MGRRGSEGTPPAHLPDFWRSSPPRRGRPGENTGPSLVEHGGGGGTGGRTFQRVVRVRTCREIREVEPAPEVPKEQRAEVWGRWLAEGRYRSGAELARAAGVSRETVSAVFMGQKRGG